MDIQVDKQVEIAWLKQQIEYLERVIPQTGIPALAEWRQRSLDKFKQELAESEENY